MGRSACGPIAVLVEKCSAVAVYPVIQQGIAWPRVKTHSKFIPSQDRGIGDTADIDYRPVYVGSGEGGCVERRSQWRTLPAGGYVTASEVGNRSDAGEFGNGIGVADL